MTVKVPPEGTRGLPIPRFMNRFAGKMVVRQFRRGGMRSQGGVSALLLETVGAKSGKPRVAALGYLEAIARSPSCVYGSADFSRR